ncbi:hypothetical protein Tco_0088019 [Tanacetum coccineum]
MVTTSTILLYLLLSTRVHTSTGAKNMMVRVWSLWHSLRDSVAVWFLVDTITGTLAFCFVHWGFCVGLCNGPGRFLKVTLLDLGNVVGFTQLALFGGGTYLEPKLYIPGASTLGVSDVRRPQLIPQLEHMGFESRNTDERDRIVINPVSTSSLNVLPVYLPESTDNPHYQRFDCHWSVPSLTKCGCTSEDDKFGQETQARVIIESAVAFHISDECCSAQHLTHLLFSLASISNALSLKSPSCLEHLYYQPLLEPSSELFSNNVTHHAPGLSKASSEDCAVGMRTRVEGDERSGADVV